ncbi:MFS general substrate transporter [Gyrodon lividus]|nr:MFS general substrate transporter [Gyrodon lividus]
MFCLAQFLDAFNNSALFSAIPALEASMGITESQSVWIISAFRLTFAFSLLISGRISDVYNPKKAFIGGVSALGLLSIGAGLLNVKIAIIISRALTGIASAMTIPSALTLLSQMCLVFFIGAFFVQWASFHWVFWFVGLVAIPVALGCLFIIPRELQNAHVKWKSLDLIGVSSLTVALILFIFAIMSGSVDGWATAAVLVPLIISILMIAGFLYWETLIPVDKAAMYDTLSLAHVTGLVVLPPRPPRTWFYNNFSVLFGLGLLPFFWWSTVFTIFMNMWQNVSRWSVISTAVHMFPIGVLAFATSFTGSLSRVFSPKRIILTDLTLLAVATTLLALGGGKLGQYWPFVFPAFTLGSAGAMLTYTHTNIAIFQATPAAMAGTVCAIFHGALQFGSAIGLAAVSSIEASVEATHGGPDEYYGRAAAFWFLLGMVVLEIISISCFYQRTDHGPPTTTKIQ